MAPKTLPAPISCTARGLRPPGNRTRLRRLVGRSPGGILLESVATGPADGRYSIFAFDPVRTVALPSGSSMDPFSRLAALCRPWRRLEPASGERLPFFAGWIGYIAYEAGRFTEPTAGWDNRASPLPLAGWTLFDTVLIHDAASDRWALAGADLPRDLSAGPRPPLGERLDRWAAFFEEAARGEPPPELDPPGPARGRWTPERESYLNLVRGALDYIRAGDIFQVNLARRLRLRVDAHPLAIYERLCAHNPAAYAAYLPVGDGASDHGAVISSSPELFLKLEGGKVTTRPIKGTRPRGSTREGDAAAAAALADSDKDRAELNMIIDLARNDLGRVCEYGTVRVVEDGEIERHPTVFHRTATVRGTLRADQDAIDLLRATFPGGSITGAPKVRAMQIINELETGGRGPYCGALGMIGLDGRLQLNLPIRTLAMAGNRLDLWVGSGIVADSEPCEELEELGAKAAGMLAALGAAETPAGLRPALAAR